MKPNSENESLSDEVLLKSIDKTLDSLSSTTNWIIGSLVIIAFSLPQPDKDGSTAATTIHIFGFDVLKDVAGVAMFTFIFGLNFYVLKLSSSLSFFYDQIASTKKKDAELLMQRHQWVCNPFAKTTSKTRPTVVDSIGYSIFILLWWIGFTLAGQLSLLSTGYTSLVITILIAALYATLGISTGLVFGKIPFLNQAPSLSSVITKNKLRDNLGWFAIAIGWILFFYVNWTQMIHWKPYHT